MAGPLVSIFGGFMVVMGIYLALTGKPESSLIWAGAALLGIGLVIDRIQSVEAKGFGVTLAPQQAVEKAKEEAEAEAPVIQIPTNTIQVLPASELWTREAVDLLVMAAGSNSKRQMNEALGGLDILNAKGTAVVRLEPISNPATTFEPTVQSESPPWQPPGDQ